MAAFGAVHVLSIDLGTSNTVAVLSAHGRPPQVVEIDGSATMPSGVFAADGGRLVAGREAQRRARLDPARYEPNPRLRIDEGNLLLGDIAVPVADALAAVLRRVAEETARRLAGDRLDEVRLTHPAQWGPVRRGMLLGAAHRVPGFGGKVTLVPEPVAAAAHFASLPDRSLRNGQLLAVYDLGAGTFDCAVVGATLTGYAVVAADGSPNLGGLDLDRALAEHLARRRSGSHPAGWQRLLWPQTVADQRARHAMGEDVRSAKEALSRHQRTEVPLPEPLACVPVTRGELEALIRPSLLRSVERLAATVRNAGLAPPSLAGVYLVGGSSRIPLVAGLIADHLRVTPTSPDRPETAIAFGAQHVPRGAGREVGRDAGREVGRDVGREAGRDVGREAGNGIAVHAAQRPARQPVPPGIGPVPPVRPDHPPAHPDPGPWFAGPRPPRRGPGRVLLVAALVAALLTVAGTAVFALTDRAGLPTAQECRQVGDKDADGFTRCLRQLAGTVPAGHDCAAGAGAVPLAQLIGVSVSCRLDSGGRTYQVVYTHADALVSSQSILDLWAAGTRHDRVEADWAGNGLRGRYVSTVDGTGGLLAFGVHDRPLYGMLIATDADGLTPGELADHFERDVQPGT